MEPRILLRTHYQANEPRLLIAAVTHCSSATESRPEDRVANALERWARENTYVISTPGAMYAVDNARHLGLLGKTNRWAHAGLAFGFLHDWKAAPPGALGRLLLPREGRLFLKVYTSGAGALVVSFAKWLLAKGSTTGAQLRDESVLETLTKEALTEYLGIATDIRSRTAIRRERDRLERTHYSASTKRHKRYPFLRTLVRLKLLQMVEADEPDVIRPDPDGRLVAFSRAIPNIETLERLCRDNAVLTALDSQMEEYKRLDLSDNLPPASIVLRAYEFAMSKGLQACPLEYLDDILAVTFPVRPRTSEPNAEGILSLAQKKWPGDVRFHVDRQGRRAFVLIGDRALAQMRQGNSVSG